MKQPFKLPVRISDVALEEINNQDDPGMRLYLLLGKTTSAQDKVIGREGMKSLVDAVYDEKIFTNYESDEEFLARIAIQPASEDDIRLYRLAKKYVESKEGKTK
jgi:hypothetical protein